MKEVSEKEAKTKISKIANKTILKGKKTQLNLNDGRNILCDKECKTNDSVILDLETKQIVKVLLLKEKENAVVIAGKHAGKSGKIEKIDLKQKMVEMKTQDTTINVLIKQLMVSEK